MCDPGVGVAGDDRVDRARGQRSGQIEDLAVGLAGREVVVRVDAPAAAADVRHDDHRVRAAMPEILRCVDDHRREGQGAEAGEVRGQGDERGAGVGQTDHPDLQPGAFDQLRAGEVRPRRRCAGRGVDQVRSEEGEARLGGAGLERAARIVARAARRRRGPDWSEVELVVADRGGVVRERVVGADDRGAFVQVRLQRPLEHVPRVEEHHAAAVTRARRPEIREVAAQAR